jgi:hypothetical protein
MGVNLYTPDRGDIIQSLFMDNETRTFISGEFDKLADSMARGFEFVDKRFDAVDKRFEGIEYRLDGIEFRLDGVEYRLDNVELRLGSLETKVDEISDTLEQEMIFTSGFRDEFAGRLKILETRFGS